MGETPYEALRELYPTYSDAELEEAKEALDAYLLLAWEIWEESLAAESESRGSSLTQEPPSSTIQTKADSPN
jgi:hypothetical protein